MNWSIKIHYLDGTKQHLTLTTLPPETVDWKILFGDKTLIMKRFNRSILDMGKHTAEYKEIYGQAFPGNPKTT